MGTADLAVVGLQNLITSTGIFARFADGTADFLADRIVSGPVPAVVGLKTEACVNEESGMPSERIVEGVATWEGQGIDECQRLINTAGPRAFRREQQHDVRTVEGALWTPELIRRGGIGLRDFVRVVVAVDPSGGGDEIGIVVAGLGRDRVAYVLRDDSQPGRLGPNNWARKSVFAYEELEADRIVAEANFGGDMVENTLKVVGGGNIPVELVTASRGKVLRAEPVVALYEQRLVYHAGNFPELEKEMTTWIPGPGAGSPNRMDALVFALTELLLPKPNRKTFRRSRPPGL